MWPRRTIKQALPALGLIPTYPLVDRLPRHLQLTRDISHALPGKDALHHPIPTHRRDRRISVNHWEAPFLELDSLTSPTPTGGLPTVNNLCRGYS